MTTPSTGDARAEERVVEAVARAIVKARAMDPDKLDDHGLMTAPIWEFHKGHARAAIEAYRKAMSEGG